MKIVYTYVPTFLIQLHFNIDMMIYRLLIFMNLILSLSIIEMFFVQKPLVGLQMLHFVRFYPIYWVLKLCSVAIVKYYFKVISVII